MQSDLFLETIKMICQMASTKLIKAVAESGYMKDLYSSSQYESLDSAINFISEKLQKEVFD